MTSYAVFLRGINVGGINIKMADLKEALKSRPFTGVKTLLASGNVVLASDLAPPAVKKEFEACPAEVLRLRRLGGGADSGPRSGARGRVPLSRRRQDHPHVPHAGLGRRLCSRSCFEARAGHWTGAEQDRLGPGGPGLAGARRRHAGQPVQQAVRQAEVQGLHHHPQPPHHDQGPGRRRTAGAGQPRRQTGRRATWAYCRLGGGPQPPR